MNLAVAGRSALVETAAEREVVVEEIASADLAGIVAEVAGEGTEIVVPVTPAALRLGQMRRSGLDLRLQLGLLRSKLNGLLLGLRRPGALRIDPLIMRNLAWVVAPRSALVVVAIPLELSLRSISVVSGRVVSSTTFF
ncbi:hypothetical protein BRADI_1g43332v3 [Brachypodium distachyon]|uniref:Uncharacterized protein n=1 Tax=Brachypodium distachyon TaxID=15368 RepID=A0A2K2DP45_BRADI|nr:hypothetical protein BRADI_1g43332v3 [Brachypodium distachyon]